MVLCAHTLVQDEAVRRLAAVVAALELVVADGLLADVDLRVVDQDVGDAAARLRLAGDDICRNNARVFVVCQPSTNGMEWNGYQPHSLKEHARGGAEGASGPARTTGPGAATAAV